MKRIIMIAAATALTCAPAMAQQQERGPQDMVQKRTEYVVKQYGLNDEQAAKLLELNQRYAEKMGPIGGQRGARGRRPGQNGQRPEPSDTAKRQRPARPEGAQRNQGERQKQMRETMEAYNNELQGILTAEQFERYKADFQKRRPARRNQN